MHPGLGTSTAERDPGAGPEPIAVVGIAALYPDARDTDAYWRLLTAPAPGPGAGAAPAVPGGLADVTVDVARFGIPPAQARSMARMQILMLETARQCLEDAGHADRPASAERTDVVVGTCFGLDRQFANALRVEGSRYARRLDRALCGPRHGGAPGDGARAAEEFRRALTRRLGASPHDRPGEIASTIPARVASAFKLRGRTLALESADATSYLCVAHAMDTLRGGLSDAVLVLAGQLREGRFTQRALAAKGLTAGAPGPGGFVPGEGVGALLLKRLSSAVHDGDRIYATILDCAIRHDARPGVFRYSTSAGHRRETATAGYRAAGVPATSVQYAECAGYGIEAESRAEFEALSDVFDGAAPGSVVLGSARERLGHTIANAGVASLSKVALALHHRTLPGGPYRPAAGADLAGTAFRTLERPQEWPEPPGGGPRRAAVSGASLTGTVAHLVLEEYRPAAAPPVPDAERPAPRASVREAAEPVAVVGFGGRFAGSPDADAYWEAMLGRRDRIGPLPESVFDRDLYFAPGALSLTHSYSDHGSAVEVPDAPPAGPRIPPNRYAAFDVAQRMALAVAGELLDRRGLLPGTGLVAVGSNLGLSRERHLDTALCLDDLDEMVRGLGALDGMPARRRDAVIAEVRARYGTPEHIDSPSALDGALASGVAALIANEYRLAAVPVAVEAACASSLAALDLAVARLRSGAADYAVAGGVELPCNARDIVLCSSLGLLSHDRITPFDKAADGFTPGDGCALFLLKRRRDALRDGDRVYGLLRGSGASNDAKSLIAPDVEGQVRAMRQAFAQTDFDPGEVDYLEAHGTGTRVGDRVEIAAAARVYSGERRERPLEVGSAKSFFGHTFAAAGAAGVLRVLQAMRHATIPANANLADLNPELELAAIPARVGLEATPWEPLAGRPRRAGVSSFGTGGINYHLLIEEHWDGTR